MFIGYFELFSVELIRIVWKYYVLEISLIYFNVFFLGVNVIIKNYYYIFIIGLFIDFIFSGFIVDIIVLEIIEGL